MALQNYYGIPILFSSKESESISEENASNNTSCLGNKKIRKKKIEKTFRLIREQYGQKGVEKNKETNEY